MQYRILVAVLTTLLLVVFSCPVLAGNLDDPGAPDSAASAMYTLEDIYNRLDSNTSATKRAEAFAEPAAGPAATGRTLDEIYEKAIPTQVPKTGRMMEGVAGSDGDLQKGLPWPDPRFTDNSDGTITDHLTGLVWLKDGNCFGTNAWSTSLTNANDLADGTCSLADNSSAGDWRLPNIREIQTLLDYSQYNGLVLPLNHPFADVQNNYYWTGTRYDMNLYPYIVTMQSGLVSADSATNLHYMWPVRDAQ